MRRLLSIISILVMMLSAESVFASGAGVPLKEIEVSTTPAARQAGAETVIKVCLVCHSLKYVKYRDLLDIGMDKEFLESLMAGETLDDRMISLTPVEVRKESYGLVPPDLSLMAIARAGGPNYIYTLLTSYYMNENGESDNHLFPGIKMPDMLGYSYTEDGSQARADIEAQARDAVAFLVWAADPNAESRRTLGVYVIAYLIVLTVLLYLVKKRIWRRVH